MTNPRAEAMKEAAHPSEEVDVTREAQPSATDLEYMKLVETSRLVSASPVLNARAAIKKADGGEQ